MEAKWIVEMMTVDGKWQTVVEGSFQRSFCFDTLAEAKEEAQFYLSHNHPGAVLRIRNGSEIVWGGLCERCSGPLLDSTAMANGICKACDLEAEVVY